MAKLKFILIPLAVLTGVYLVYFSLISENTLVLHPKGMIARKEFNLITTNVLWMLVLIIPTFFAILLTVWKYQAKKKPEYKPNKTYGFKYQLLLWGIPSLFVSILAVITWNATHELDPYQPLTSEEDHMIIQVVALDWKWLFIYPEQGIATVNFVKFPQKKPIRFELAADGSPMNAFWIPQLSGQIYCMAGMVTPLHIIADGPGTYSGKASEINGKGYAKMTFTAQSCSEEEFQSWVAYVKESPLQLNAEKYSTLSLPSVGNPVELYSYVDTHLFGKIVMKVHHP